MSSLKSEATQLVEITNDDSVNFINRCTNQIKKVLFENKLINYEFCFRIHQNRFVLCNRFRCHGCCWIFNKIGLYSNQQYHFELSQQNFEKKTLMSCSEIK